MLMALKVCVGSSPDLSRNSHVRFTPLSRIGPLRAVICPRCQPGALLHRRFRVVSFRPAAARGIFLAVDRCHMRRVFIEIRPSDSKLLAVFVDPFPELFSGVPSLPPGPAFDANHIGRKPVAIAATETATMVRSISRCLQAARDRLTIVIAERAGYARRQPSLLRRVERVKKL